jgi:hypothetical protein
VKRRGLLPLARLDFVPEVSSLEGLADSRDDSSESLSESGITNPCSSPDPTYSEDDSDGSEGIYLLRRVVTFLFGRCSEELLSSDKDKAGEIALFCVRDGRSGDAGWTIRRWDLAGGEDKGRICFGSSGDALLTFDTRVFLPSECLIETSWPVLFGDEMDDAFNMPASVVVTCRSRFAIESRPGTFLDGLLWDGGRVGPSSLDKDAVK